MDYQNNLLIQFVIDGLSKQSVDTIRNTLKTKKSDKWKIYILGHGAPDAHQICGLNLQDFRALLAFFNNDIVVDFLVYQTCFGGSKNQLKEVYIQNQGIFKTFKFPIICSCLTNCVSFAGLGKNMCVPFKEPSFKGLFTKLNNSSIIEKKASRILNAVNEFTKCLDYAANFHWANNLLLVRMPGNQYFEPVVDNEFVFRASAMPMMDEKLRKICSDIFKFKCVLIDKPIINVIDLRQFSNFIICSGIARSNHYIKELLLPAYIDVTQPDELLQQLAYLFYSLAYLDKNKIFYIENLRLGNILVAQNIMLSQEKACLLDQDQIITLRAKCGGVYYNGQVLFQIKLNIPTIKANDLSPQNKLWVKQYINSYNANIKHLLEKQKKPNITFFWSPSDVDKNEVFTVVEDLQT